MKLTEKIMNISSMQLYAQMMEEIGQFEMYCRNELLLIEGCFNIALRYRNELNKCLDTYTFICEADEIRFFKNIKPMFLAVIEFNTLRYQASLFKPVGNKTQLLLYWKHELKRIEKFFSKQKEFYQYFTGGQTDKDDFYFASYKKEKELQCGYFFNSKDSVSHSHLAARILAYSSYQEYVESALGLLVQSNMNIQSGKAITTALF